MGPALWIMDQFHIGSDDNTDKHNSTEHICFSSVNGRTIAWVILQQCLVTSPGFMPILLHGLWPHSGATPKSKDEQLLTVKMN
jgi:hypothetical protein